jgi:superfamily II DNA or RNA helicase
MARPPKSPAAPSAFVNLRGEALDPAAPRRNPPALTPEVAEERAQLEESGLPEADLETVWDALCLAGSARGKTWLMAFLRGLDRRTVAGHLFTPLELESALRRLRLAGRIADADGMGFDIEAAQRIEHLPRVLAAEADRPRPGGRPGQGVKDGRPAAAPDTAAAPWEAWARASSPYGYQTAEPAIPQFRHRRELQAFARLVIYGGLTLARFKQLTLRVMGAAAQPEVLAEAVNMPFVPALWERMDGELRTHLTELFASGFNIDAATWRPLVAWFEARLDKAPRDVPPNLRVLIAERRLHAGDMAGCDAALKDLSGAGLPLLRAAQVAWSGRWAEAAAAFSTGLKEAAKALQAKRGLLDMQLGQWYVLSLLAQPDAAAWTQAHKFCVAESGTRTPPPDEGWGLWAHAAAVRLGDATLVPSAFAWPGTPYLQRRINECANRLILAAWLGHLPQGWTPEAVASIARGLHADGKPWKADLLRQAAERVGLPVPPREAGDGAPWTVPFYGRPQEPWRDALAAIEALGEVRGSTAASAAPATLQWRLTLDDEGRPSQVEPFERLEGPRGLSKPKAVTLSRVKKSPRLDPRDAAVARCIDGARWAPGQLAIDVTGAVIALVGHPHLVLADAPEQLIDLREALPVLEVQRHRGEDGVESFVFLLSDALVSPRPPDPGVRFTTSDASTESERRNSVRVVRDGPDAARLIRISAAQRRVAELVSKRWAVPVDAKAELDAALRVLAGHFQLHSDADAGQAVPSESRLRAQLSPNTNGLQLRLVAQPFGAFGPALPPGAGRARLITQHEGLSLSTERDLAAERVHLAEVLDALPALEGCETGEATWQLDDPEDALAAIERLSQLAGVSGLDWPRGKPVNVVTPKGDALQVKVGSGADWFAIDGELRIDEHRVIGLQQLMKLAHESRRGRFVTLGEGEVLALTDRLRQQLADLQAMSRADKGKLVLPTAAAAWLAETLDGAELSGDKRWGQRLARLDEAAALEPELPRSLQAQLRGYQLEGFTWMARLAHAGLGACLADDMGLGKTVQTLALLLQRAELGPALVIAPTSVCGNWAVEAERFAPSLNVTIFGEGDRRSAIEQAGPGDLVIASYSLAQIESDAFAGREWATLVLDEAQALKNAATKRAKAIGTLNAGFRLALSGTPVENRLSDLWSIMNLLNPGLLGSATQFGERFAGPIERERDEPSRLRLRRLVSPFLLRRTKAQVLTDLPPRTEIIHRVEPGPEERSFLEALRRNAIERVAALASDTGEGQASFHVLAELTRLRRAACDPRLVSPELGLIGAKAAEFEQLAIELVAGRHKALVFSQFTDFLGLLGERLDAAGIAYQYLDGSTPAAERTKRVAAFQRGEGELFLISLKAGGFGLNLTAADYVLIVDPWWNPAAEDQAMGRAHRIGQHRPVTVYRLVTAGSIEERIVDLHRDKRTLADGILEGQDGSAPLRADELRDLLKGA